MNSILVEQNFSKDLKKYTTARTNTFLHENVLSIEKFYLNFDILIAPMQKWYKY